MQPLRILSKNPARSARALPEFHKFMCEFNENVKFIRGGVCKFICEFDEDVEEGVFVTPHIG